MAISKSMCGTMKVMEVKSIREFQALTLVQLRDSRASWVGVTDDVWGLGLATEAVGSAEECSTTYPGLK